MKQHTDSVGDHLADRYAIEDLVYTYNHAIDRRDAVLFESLWMPDARCGSMIGRDAIVAALVSTAQKFADLNHLTTNLVIQIDGANAHARSKSLAMRRLVGSDLPGPLTVVLYEDDFVRDGPLWKFRRRTFTADLLGRSGEA